MNFFKNLIRKRLKDSSTRLTVPLKEIFSDKLERNTFVIKRKFNPGNIDNDLHASNLLLENDTYGGENEDTSCSFRSLTAIHRDHSTGTRRAQLSVQNAVHISGGGVIAGRVACNRTTLSIRPKVSDLSIKKPVAVGFDFFRIGIEGNCKDIDFQDGVSGHLVQYRIDVPVSTKIKGKFFSGYTVDYSKMNIQGELDLPVHGLLIGDHENPSRVSNHGITSLPDALNTLNGELKLPKYDKNRDDSQKYPPNNFLYTDNEGNVKSCPLPDILLEAIKNKK